MTDADQDDHHLNCIQGIRALPILFVEPFVLIPQEESVLSGRRHKDRSALVAQKNRVNRE